MELFPGTVRLRRPCRDHFYNLSGAQSRCPFTGPASAIALGYFKRLLAGSDQSPFRLGAGAISEPALSPASAAARRAIRGHGEEAPLCEGARAVGDESGASAGVGTTFGGGAETRPKLQAPPKVF